MISDKPIISLKVSAIYDNDRLVNYEVIEKHLDNTGVVQSFFIDKADMKQHIKDLIRGI